MCQRRNEGKAREGRKMDIAGGVIICSERLMCMHLNVVPAAGPPQITVVSYFATWSTSGRSNAKQLPLA